MIKLTLSEGGFVIHRITHLTKKSISAWFTAEGELIDAEYMPSERSVVRKGGVWLSLQSVGRTWRI